MKPDDTHSVIIKHKHKNGNEFENEHGENISENGDSYESVDSDETEDEYGLDSIEGPTRPVNHDLENKRLKRKHNKSRNSCSVCKERKIKCDQKVPMCSYCERKNIDCPYLMMTPFQIHRILGKNMRNAKSSPNASFRAGSEDKLLDSAYGPANSNMSIDATHATNSNLYSYRITGTINLNTDSDQQEDLVYQVHGMESALLPPSLGNNTENFNEGVSHDYIPVRTNYIPNQTSDPYSAEQPYARNSIPLYANTRRSNKTFNTSHDIIIRHAEKFYETSFSLASYLIHQDYQSIFKMLQGQKMDKYIRLDYVHILCISQIYNILLRKSHLLLAMDYYKNTILKQNMVPFANYKAKLAIACECDNVSVIFIDEITKIMKSEYLAHFSRFSVGAANLFLGSFVILDDCLGYHFKKGLEYDMSFEEGNKAIQLVGIFSTGYYSMIMEKSREAMLMTSTNILSAHIITVFRRFLIPNYSSKLFDDFKNVANRSTLLYPSDVNYENLKIFCGEHSKLLKVNVQNHTLIGFNNGYIIRLFNSFKMIVPFDIADFGMDNEDIYVGRDSDIIIRLFFYTLSSVLDGVLPGVENLVSDSFYGQQWDIYELSNIPKLMNLLKSISNKKFKLIGIFLIRTALFMRCHREYYMNYLASFTLDTLLDEESELSLNQRYIRLLNFKEEGILDEIPVKNFTLDKGQFFRNWNYPNASKLKPKRANKVWENKIMNHFQEDEDALIEDYMNSNNGFFTLDYDPTAALSEERSVTMQTTFIDGCQMKMLWKLTTYIRINNL